MAAEIPDYYRQFAEKRAASPAEPARKEGGRRRDSNVPPPTIEYRADTFSIQLYEEWEDKTVFVLAGPATDGVQHNITISGSTEIELDSLVDFADWQVKTLEENLKGCRLLLKEPTELQNGMPAYRAIFVWHPTDGVRLYQEQLYVLHDGHGYTITASFTKKTRKTLGPRVERMMLSFDPTADVARTKPARSRTR